MIRNFGRGCRHGLGLSASAIVYGGTDYPHDPSDLGRCLQVSAGPPLHMLGRSPEWTALVLHWAELLEMLAEERSTGNAPRTYARMRELFSAARKPKAAP